MLMKSSKMDIFFIFVCFIGLFAFTVAEDPLEVIFENATRVDALVGSTNIHFRCQFNRGAMFVIKHSIDIVHVNPINSEETILSSAGELVEGKPEFYRVEVNEHPELAKHMLLDFTIATVRLQDDGIFKCHVHGAGEEAVAKREVVVHRPFSSLKLKLGDLDALEDSPTDPLQIDHGDYKVSCIAEGSNPGSEDVHLSFHGVMMDHSKPAVTPMEGPERIFKTEINGDLNIVVSNSGQELVCQATDSTGQSKSVKLSISVNTYDPVVFCNDTEAHIGQDNPMIICTVNHTGLEVDGYSYQLGDTGEIFKAGDNSHPKNIEVSVSDVAPGTSVVTLDLHKAEERFLDKNYYILIDLKGGHTSKESVRLSKKEAPIPDNRSGGGNNGGNPGGSSDDNDGPGHGARFTPVAVLYLLCVVAAFWSWH